jgi:hypothetical protein
MTNKEVWIVFTKNSPLEVCSIDIDGCDFYFAEVYVPIESNSGTTSLDTIINHAKDALAAERLVLVDVPKCVRYSEQEWTLDTAMNKEVHTLAKQALVSGAVQFGGFRSEEIEELCQYHLSMNELDA